MLRKREVDRKLTKLVSLTDELKKRKIEENIRKENLKNQLRLQQNELQDLADSIEKKHQNRYFLILFFFF